MFIVSHSKHLTAEVVQDSAGEIRLTFLTSAMADQDREKLARVLARTLKTMEVALIVEGLL